MEDVHMKKNLQDMDAICSVCKIKNPVMYQVLSTEESLQNLCSLVCLRTYCHVNSVHKIVGPFSAASNSVARVSHAESLNVNNSVDVTSSQQAVTPYKQIVIVRPPAPKEMHNKATSCKPKIHSKYVSIYPRFPDKETQTDDKKPILIPVPVPIFVPVLTLMYSNPYPVPVPFPLPLPVPMFIPIRRNSHDEILKDMKEIQEKIPANPLEAELLIMAERVASSSKMDTNSNSDTDAVDTAANEPVEDINTHVTEEYLWMTKQLGAHSLDVLLETLLYFNTKYFKLTTVEEHLQLSFSRVKKCLKEKPNELGAAVSAGSESAVLRFYPPQSTLVVNSDKEVFYEQQENETQPFRCPVKLYEQYLSYCPDSVKMRDDVFYLVPKISCGQDRPIFSTTAVDEQTLQKMLNKVKMVQEINVALLSK